MTKKITDEYRSDKADIMEREMAQKNEFRAEVRRNAALLKIDIIKKIEGIVKRIGNLPIMMSQYKISWLPTYIEQKETVARSQTDSVSSRCYYVDSIHNDSDGYLSVDVRIYTRTSKERTRFCDRLNCNVPAPGISLDSQNMSRGKIMITMMEMPINALLAVEVALCDVLAIKRRMDAAKKKEESIII